MADTMNTTTGIVYVISIPGVSLLPADQVIRANTGVYAPDHLEIPNGITLEIASTAILEIG